MSEVQEAIAKMQSAAQGHVEPTKDELEHLGRKVGIELDKRHDIPELIDTLPLPKRVI